jgi:hypothetical protein
MAALLQTPTVFVIRRAASTPARLRCPTKFPGSNESSAGGRVRVGSGRGGKGLRLRGRLLQGPSKGLRLRGRLLQGGQGSVGARLARERGSLRSFHADQDFFGAGVDMVIGILEDAHTLIACPPATVSVLLHPPLVVYWREPRFAPFFSCARRGPSPRSYRPGHSHRPAHSVTTSKQRPARRQTDSLEMKRVGCQ